MKRAFAVALFSMLLVSALAGTLLVVSSVDAAGAPNSWEAMKPMPTGSARAEESGGPESETPVEIQVESPIYKIYTADSVPLTFTVRLSLPPSFDLFKYESLLYCLDGEEAQMQDLSGSYPKQRPPGLGREKWNLRETFSIDLGGLTEGPHYLYVNVTIRGGNFAGGNLPLLNGISSTIRFVSDTTVPPNIYVMSPQNQTYPTTDVFVNFTVSDPVSWMGYSLDGAANETIKGNTTLTGLSAGTHTLTVYAEDTAGSAGASQPITFKVETQPTEQTTEPEPQSEPFPTTLIAIAVVIAVVVIAGLIFYLRKRKHSRSTEAT